MNLFLVLYFLSPLLFVTVVLNCKNLFLSFERLRIDVFNTNKYDWRLKIHSPRHIVHSCWILLEKYEHFNLLKKHENIYNYTFGTPRFWEKKQNLNTLWWFGHFLALWKKNVSKWAKLLQKFLQKNEIQNKIGGRKWHLAGQNSAERSG